MKIARRVIVYGKVQGVFFRAFTKQTATEAKVAGWVRNLPDGTVESFLEGEEKDVEKVIEAIRRGPPASRVDQVKIFEEEITQAKDFIILY